ncbi:SAM-dependent methyltransferase [Terrilactibacillus sp. S3-3]|nr:SAM-dependent methyltransferase [Terrilactibacillus sp. S3-3]
MERIRLSKRLALIASFIPRESVLADIGSDHAHLPAYAYQQGWIKKKSDSRRGKRRPVSDRPGHRPGAGDRAGNICPSGRRVSGH